MRGAITLAMAAMILISGLIPASAAGSRELIFGMSAPLSGVDADFGDEFRRGIMAYLDHVNESGGIHGRTLRVVVMDHYAARQEKGKRSAYGYSFPRFEGFLNCRALREIVKRMGRQPGRNRLPSVIESMDSPDLGIGRPVRFTPGTHQGVNTVYSTTPVNGRDQRIRSWERWRK